MLVQYEVENSSHRLLLDVEQHADQNCEQREYKPKKLVVVLTNVRNALDPDVVVFAPVKELKAIARRFSGVRPNGKLGDVLNENETLGVENDEIPKSLAWHVLFTERLAENHQRVDHVNKPAIHHGGQNHEGIGDPLHVGEHHLEQKARVVVEEHGGGEVVVFAEAFPGLQS